jgi:hypothetical protein
MRTLKTLDFEAAIGEAVAQAAFACAKGLGEYRAGTNQPGTRAAMFDRMVDLHSLWREAHKRGLRFGDAVARQGKRALTERVPGLSDDAAGLLLDMTMDLFRRIVFEAKTLN